MPQVSSSHYRFSEYVNRERWASYWCQVQSVLRNGGQTVLYIGVGDNIVPSILELQGLDVARFDHDAQLGADYASDIREIDRSVPTAGFDVVVCCQMLEHLPFEDFETVIAKLARIAKKGLILSLPYRYRRVFDVKFKIPLIPESHIYLDIPKFWHRWRFNGQHYWEVGTRGYSRRRIDEVLRRHGNIRRRYRPPENRYHIFYEVDTSPASPSRPASPDVAP